jgi:murein DD-endopeptidase MepM/ murein hydrolase activator NlpD
VLIDHGGGYSTLYAHNSQLLVSPGQQVERGQVISLSGSTGYSSGPHLHFEIRVNNEREDPLSGNLLSTPKNMMIIE